jgi:hypothetical protein
VTSIYEGTSEIQRGIIGRAMLHRCEQRKKERALGAVNLWPGNP